MWTETERVDVLYLDTLTQWLAEDEKKQSGWGDIGWEKEEHNLVKVGS